MFVSEFFLKNVKLIKILRDNFQQFKKANENTYMRQIF